MVELPNNRRTTEQLPAAAEERRRRTRELPQQMAQIRSRAENSQWGIAVTVDAHGALHNLEVSEAALRLGPEAIGAEIVRLAGFAQRGALRQGVDVLGDALGDAQALDMMRSSGLGDMIDPDAPVIPYTPGVDPNAHTWNVIRSD